MNHALFVIEWPIIKTLARGLSNDRGSAVVLWRCYGSGERRFYMTQEENLCIYTKENDTEAHFRNQEHIIPACIGGMQKLPKGYVSDEIE